MKDTGVCWIDSLAAHTPSRTMRAIRNVTFDLVTLTKHAITFITLCNYIANRKLLKLRHDFFVLIYLYLCWMELS